MNDTETLVVTGVLIGLGAISMVLQFRWMKQIATDNDRYQAGVKRAELDAEQKAAIRVAHAAWDEAISEERAALREDLHWSGVEAEWLAFLEGWGTLDEAGR